MDDSHTWTVYLSNGGSVRVEADGWQVGPNGDLTFINGPYNSRPFFVQAFASGTWREVSQFA